MDFRLAAAAAFLAVIPLSPVTAAPADIAAAVAAEGRSEADRALDASRKPAEMLEFLGLEAGDRAFDFFAGAGYYSEIMARAVGPDGRVIAWNPPGIAANERAKAAWAGVRERNVNASMFATPLPALGLAPSSFDFAMLHLVYHDAYWESAQFNFVRVEPDEVLAKLFRAMKPGGIVGVIDHVGSAGDTRAIVAATHRIDPETIKADFARAGFELAGESTALRVEGDDYTKSVFDPALRGKTDRVAYKFVKPVPPCNADAAQAFVGQRFSAAVEARAKAAAGARTVRSLTSGSPMTMDYRPDRLNIEYAPGGKIVNLNCG